MDANIEAILKIRGAAKINVARTGPILRSKMIDNSLLNFFFNDKMTARTLFQPNFEEGVSKVVRKRHLLIKGRTKLKKQIMKNTAKCK